MTDATNAILELDRRALYRRFESLSDEALEAEYKGILAELGVEGPSSYGAGLPRPQRRVLGVYEQELCERLGAWPPL